MLYEAGSGEEEDAGSDEDAEEEGGNIEIRIAPQTDNTGKNSFSSITTYCCNALE